MGCKTPEELFTGKGREIGHFRIFGCLAYSHVPSEKRTKLEPTAEKGIFVGYDETSKAFRIYLPSQRKVVVRRDVRFEEEKAFRKSIESELKEQQVAPPQVTSAPSQVTSYRYIQFRDSVYRDYWYRDKFTNHKFTGFTFR